MVMLDLAVRRKLISSNPALHVKPLKKDTRAPHEKRRPFKLEQLNRFFTSSFYQSCAPGTKAPYLGKDRDWRFWLPLIMLFSGAQPNEIAQLRVQDVKKSVGGTWYVDLTVGADGSSVKVKTEMSGRRIPLHEELLLFGLLGFVAERRKQDGEAADLFPTLKPDKYGNRAWYAAKRINETFLPASIKVRADQALYSLRHNVRDASDG